MYRILYQPAPLWGERKDQTTKAKQHHLHSVKSRAILLIQSAGNITKNDWSGNTSWRKWSLIRIWKRVQFGEIAKRRQACWAFQTREKNEQRCGVRNVVNCLETMRALLNSCWEGRFYMALNVYLRSIWDPMSVFHRALGLFRRGLSFKNSIGTGWGKGRWQVGKLSGQRFRPSISMENWPHVFHSIYWEIM